MAPVGSPNLGIPGGVQPVPRSGARVGDGLPGYIDPVCGSRHADRPRVPPQ
ncbi:hypothetical protein HX744_28315 [Pseudonocardia sp. ICBG1122]|nr:hypothetical protein [Pseudonocardia pini]NWJ72980.1 hypothetical protein [Pseudonocardia pini]NWJ74377.1 hypothetical protein [Pseudonocardia pini]